MIAIGLLIFDLALGLVLWEWETIADRWWRS